MLDKQEFNSVLEKQVEEEEEEGESRMGVGGCEGGTCKSNIVFRPAEMPWLLGSLYRDTFNADLGRCFVRRHSAN